MNRSLSLRVLRPALRAGPTSAVLSRPSALVRFSPLFLPGKTSASTSTSRTPSLLATRAYATSSKGDKDKDKGAKDAGQKSGDTPAKSDKAAFVDQQNLTSRAMDEVGPSRVESEHESNVQCPMSDSSPDPDSFGPSSSTSTRPSR
jgi:hypothetical protein